MAGFLLARLPSNPQIDDGGVSKTALPVVAAAASWMETMKMPLRKVYEVYTRSEMAIQAWRSGEMSANLQRSHREANEKRAGNAPHAPMHIPDELEDALEQRLGPDLCSKLDEDLDFRKLTGDEVMRFMGAMGVPINGRMLGVQLPTLAEATKGLRR